MLTAGAAGGRMRRAGIEQRDLLASASDRTLQGNKYWSPRRRRLSELPGVKACRR